MFEVLSRLFGKRLSCFFSFRRQCQLCLSHVLTHSGDLLCSPSLSTTSAESCHYGGDKLIADGLIFERSSLHWSIKSLKAVY